MNFILAQIAGTIASILAITASQMKTKKHFLLIYIFSYAFFILDFVLLKAYSGIINNVILFILTIISNKYNNKKIPKYLIIIFFIFIIIGNIISYQNIYSLLPFLASIFYVIALITKNMKIVRQTTIVQKLSWTLYDFIVKSYSTFVMDIISIVSIFIAIIRYDKNNNSGADA